MGTRHQPHSARSFELAVRAVGSALARPGWGATCFGKGCPGLGTLPSRTARPRGRRPGPVARFPWCLLLPWEQGFTLRLLRARGGRPRKGVMVPAAGPRRGGGAGLAPRRTRSRPRDGAVPGGSLRRRCRAACTMVVLRVLTRSLTRPVSRTVRLSTGDSAGAPWLFPVDADTSPCRSEGATAGSPRVFVCDCVLARPGVAAGRAHVHPDGSCFVAGRGWVCCRARTPPSERRLFHSRKERGSVPGTHTSIRTAAGRLWVVAGLGRPASWARSGAPHHS